MIIVLLLAMIVFGFFLFRQTERRPAPQLPTPTTVAP